MRGFFRSSSKGTANEGWREGGREGGRGEGGGEMNGQFFHFLRTYLDPLQKATFLPPLPFSLPSSLPPSLPPYLRTN